MDNKFRMIILGLAFSLLIIRPTSGFAWHDYTDDGDSWDYPGSGRDHPYSEYIDRRNYYIDPSSYTLSGPAIVAAPAQPDVFTVNIPNSHGGYTAVIIKRSGNGFIGPQGEFYPEFPKVFQLKMMYAK